MDKSTSIHRALISVADKSGVADFAIFLAQRGVEILSTGGTASALREAGVDVIDVSSYTGFDEIMDGRVKTLHPKIHAGLLARRGVDDAVLAERDFGMIDLLVVNLYPFRQTIEKANVSFDEAIENIDIGGPAMLRAAAKNHADVTVVVDHADYAVVRKQIEHDGEVSSSLRRRLATDAFAHTARYDGMVSSWLSAQQPAQSDTVDRDASPLPPLINYQFKKIQDMRYGENPHQRAAFYADCNVDDYGGTLAGAHSVQGKPLSYNNIADADAALECVRAFSRSNTQAACVIVKHANPCGVAVRGSNLQAYEAAFITDPTSAFGGIIAFNRPLDEVTARAIVDRQFVEVILAPQIDQAAAAVFAEKPAIRVLETGEAQTVTDDPLLVKCVSGGVLVQDVDTGFVAAADMQVVSKRAPSAAELVDLEFACQVVKYVKSNAIVYVREQATIGVGAGQMSRVYSARIAGIKAEDEKLTVAGSVMASDAFFPFRDGIDAAAEVGIVAVVQPGGSIRDEEIIAAADEHDIAMVFTHMRHFRH